VIGSVADVTRITRSAVFSEQSSRAAVSGSSRRIYAALTLPTDDCGAGILLRALSLDQDMNAIELDEATQAEATITDVAEAIRDLVPGLSVPEAPIDAGAGPGGDPFASLLQKIGATTVVELDRLIGELQEAKAYLQSEGERIERETVGYVALSQTALESVKIISETVGEWRKAGHPVRGNNGA
jgi:hypothetical protein